MALYIIVVNGAVVLNESRHSPNEPRQYSRMQAELEVKKLCDQPGRQIFLLEVKEEIITSAEIKIVRNSHEPIVETGLRGTCYTEPDKIHAVHSHPDCKGWHSETKKEG